MNTENTDEIDTNLSGLRWENQNFYLDGEVFVPQIYGLKECNEPISLEYNTVSIHLDGKVSADLNWKSARRYRPKML